MRTKKNLSVLTFESKKMLNYNDFDQTKWQKIKDDYNLWWADKSPRPLIQGFLQGCDPIVEKGEIDFKHFQSFYDLDVPADKIAQAIEYNLSTTRFLGDAYPFYFPNFGPGVIAAFMGAELVNSTEQNTVWFEPVEQQEVKDISFKYDPDNNWVKRIEDIVKAVQNRIADKVQISLTDLGGNLDILSSFRPSEKLMFDLFDCPDEVEKLNWQAHDVWWKYYEHFNEIYKTTNPGFSAWDGIFSEKPFYMLQCDFCFMIGPDHFAKFAKPELEKTAQKLDNAFYHLDGPGELAHLDALLEIDAIKGIQWIPGAGAETIENWPDVYKKITDAGKLIQIFAHQTEKKFDIIDIIASQTGRADNIIYRIDTKLEDQQKLEDLIAKYS